VKVNGIDYIAIHRTSRDQYCGVFFGLAVAFDLVPEVRDDVRDLVTRLLDFLLDHHWTIALPGGGFSTVFIGKPEQQLTLTRIGAHVNPKKFGAKYKKLRVALAALVIVPLSAETLDPHNAYFKFNLGAINMFNLIRLEDDGLARKLYRKAYAVVRRTTDDHGNAHFNMIDRGIGKANTARDTATVAMLEEWLKRPRRDFWIDLTGKYKNCGQKDRACKAIPIAERVNTDFLWQRSPFMLFGGGTGKIETPGIDFILPYWMGRHYGVIA